MLVRGKKGSLRFGSFEIDFPARRLLHRGVAVPVTDKAWQVLCAIVSNPGRVVSKEDLQKRVWPDTHVEEATIAQNIFTLRRVLGEREPQSNYIETIPKVGYRFLGKVERLPGQEAETPAALQPGAAGDGEAPERPRSHVQAAVAAVVLLALLAGIALVRYQWRVQAARAPISSIAVLPFANVSADVQQDYLADGLTDALLTDLARTSGLRVISRTSAMSYKGKKQKLDTIADELNVDAVIEGELRSAAGRLYIDVRLMDARHERNLWAKRYESDSRNFIAVEQHINSDIEQQLQSSSGQSKSTVPISADSAVPEAQLAYLEGRYFWNKRTEADYLRAIDRFQRAIAYDPRYAKAYAGLADAYALLGSLPIAGMSRSEAMRKAEESATRAIELDPSLAEAHASLAFVRMHYKWDWSGAEAEFRRALELDPNYATARQWHGYLLLSQGKNEQAIAEMRHAQSNDPLSLIIRTDLAEFLYHSRRYDEALQQAQKALEIDPNFAMAYMWRGYALLGKGDHAAAISAFQKGYEVSGGNLWMKFDLAIAYARAGNRRRANAELRELKSLSAPRHGTAEQFATVYAALGDEETSFRYLDQAISERDGALILLKQDPVWDSLRADPRFTAVLARVGL